MEKANNKPSEIEGARQGEDLKKTDKAGPTLIPMNVEQLNSKKSEEKMQLLTKNIFMTINATCDEMSDEFTIYEMIEVLLRVQHSFVKRFLDAQHQGKV